MSFSRVDFGISHLKIQILVRKGKEYIRPNMSGINSHLKSFGISDSEKTKDDYLHDSYIYLLAMEAFL